MQATVYQKIAAELLAQLEGKLPAGVVLVSSREETDCGGCARELAQALSSLGVTAGVESPSETVTAQTAEETVQSMLQKQDLSLIPLKALTSPAGLLTAGVVKNALLCERRGVSRTDEIRETLDLLRNLRVNPLGFVLE